MFYEVLFMNSKYTDHVHDLLFFLNVLTILAWSSISCFRLYPLMNMFKILSISLILIKFNVVMHTYSNIVSLT